MGQAQVSPQPKRKQYRLVLVLVTSYWFESNMMTAIIAGRLVCEEIKNTIISSHRHFLDKWDYEMDDDIVDTVVGLDMSMKYTGGITIRQRISLHQTCFTKHHNYNPDKITKRVIEQFLTSVYLRHIKYDHVIQNYKKMKPFIMKDLGFILRYLARTQPTKQTISLARFIIEEGLYSWTIDVIRGQEMKEGKLNYSILLRAALMCNFCNTVKEFDLLSPKFIDELMRLLHPINMSLRHLDFPLLNSRSRISRMFAKYDWKQMTKCEIERHQPYNDKNLSEDNNVVGFVKILRYDIVYSALVKECYMVFEFTKADNVKQGRLVYCEMDYTSE